MVIIRTLAGELFNSSDILLDIINPLLLDNYDPSLLEDPRLQILLFKQDDKIVKCEFVIDDNRFMTLKDVIMYLNQLEDKNIVITIVFIQKPTPPSYPSIGLDIIRTTHCDDLCGLPEEPSCFLEWYGYENNIKRLLDKDSNDFPYRNETDKYRFTCYCYSFDNIEEAITYAIIKRFNEQNITPNSKIYLDAYIKPGSYRYKLFEIRVLEQEIYSNLLTLPEWKEYFDLWDTFWMMSSQEQQFAKLNSNQHMYVHNQ
jgi:hypothetical protein